MSFSYGSENRWYDQFFEKGKAINAAKFVCANALVVGEHHGALAVTVMAAGAVKVAADKTFKLTLQGSDTEDGPFADIPGAPEVTITGTTSTGTSFADGDILCKLVLPDTKRYVKVKVTSDATSSGTVDVVLSYLAR